MYGFVTTRLIHSVVYATKQSHEFVRPSTRLVLNCHCDGTLGVVDDLLFHVRYNDCAETARQLRLR